MMQYVLAAAIAAAATFGVVWYGLNNPLPDPAVQEATTPEATAPLTAPPRLVRRVDPEISFGARPDFVVRVDVPQASADNAEGPIHFLLGEVQSRAYPDRIVHYQRIVLEPTTGEAAIALRQFQIPLDPALSTMTIHGLTRTRDGEVTDLTAEIRHDVVSADTAQTASILTGAVIIVLRLPQSRPGDVLDLDYTLEERFPVPGWRPSLRLPLATMAMFDQIHLRSIWPSSSLHYALLGAVPEMTETQEHGLTTLSFGPAAFQPPEPEPFTPPWRNPQPQLVASAFESWNAVAVWGASLFQTMPDADIERIAAEIREAHTDHDEQIMAALNYVQREIDYFAITLGQGGYQPLLPSETLRYSEGDCKAKALLLLSILADLGIDSRVALVSSLEGRSLDDMPPTPQAFDHAIVTLTSGNRRYWLDPTRTEQGGGLWDLPEEEWGHALILDSQSFDLTAVSTRAHRLPYIDVEDRYSLRSASRGDNQAILHVEWRFRGAAADAVRAASVTRGEDSIGNSLAETYSARFLQSAPIGEPTIADEADDGVVVRFVMTVTLDDFSAANASKPAYLFAANAANRSIIPVDLAGRVAPLMLPYPYDVRQQVIVNLPDGAEDWAWPLLENGPTDMESAMLGSILSTSVDNDAFSISDSYTVDGLTISLTSRTRIFTAELDPALFLRTTNDLMVVDPVAYFLVGERALLQPDRGASRRLTSPTTHPDYRDPATPY
tara:strand:- start:21602 stop:23770 length:2169 start_codon:yes stop_codon:yes gene_type:complete